jgi:hypothetical protein
MKQREVLHPVFVGQIVVFSTLHAGQQIVCLDSLNLKFKPQSSQRTQRKKRFFHNLLAYPKGGMQIF